MGEHTGLPWEFRDGFIIANGEALKLVGVQIPMVSSAARVEAIHNAKLIVRSVNTSPAVADLVKALELAEQLYQVGLLKAPDGLANEVVAARRAALSRFRELEKGNV